MSKITAYLEAIAEWHREHHPESAAALQPGLTEAQLEERTRVLPYPLPEPLRALYRWHNGQRNNQPFFSNFTFYPLEEAIEEYQLGRETAAESQREWPSGWFPVFGFQGDFFLVDLSQAQGRSPVYFYLSEETEVPVWYENLEQMLKTLCTCFEQGAYYLDEDEIFLEDFELSEQIRLRLNRSVDHYAELEAVTDFEPWQEREEEQDGSVTVTTWHSEHQHTVEHYGPDGRKRWHNFYWGEQLHRRDVWDFQGPSEVVITTEHYSGILFSTRAYATVLPGGEVLTQRVETLLNGEVVSEEDFSQSETESDD